MKFGKKYTDVKDEPTGGDSGGTTFLRTFKPGDTEIFIVQDPEEWDAYYEHSQFKIGGFPFPCSDEDNETGDCPGCNHPSEDVQKRGRKFVIQAFTLTQDKQGNDVEYLNAYKVPRAIADKLNLRYERRGTLKDRTYTISRISTGPNPYDVEYDIEANDPVKRDLSDVELIDVPAILQEMFDDRNGRKGDSGKSGGGLKIKTEEEPKKDKKKKKDKSGKAPKAGKKGGDDSTETESTEAVKASAPAGSQRAKTGNPDDAPFDGDEYVETEYSWEDLEGMKKAQLLDVIEYEQKFGKLPTQNLEDMSKEELLEWLGERV